MNLAPLKLPRIDGLDRINDSDELALTLLQHGTHAAVSCVNWPQAFPEAPSVSFAAAHSGTALYFLFKVSDAPMRACNTADQSPVSMDSCVEIFLQPDVGGEYWNFEFNCLGALNASHRMTRPAPIRLNHAELASVRRYPSLTADRVGNDARGSWQLAVVIPLRLMGIGEAAPGTVLHGNIYACASAAEPPYYLSLLPINTPAPDYHRPEFFGTIILL